MDFDNYDNNYEMKDWNEVENQNEVTAEQEQEQEQEREQEQETNFDEFEDVVVRLEGLEAQEREVNMDLGGINGAIAERNDIPNVNRDIAGIKRSITNDVKKVFKDIFNVTIEKKEWS